MLSIVDQFNQLSSDLLPRYHIFKEIKVHSHD